MLRTNQDKLVMMSVVGEISSPKMHLPYKITTMGEAVILPGTGGVTYNLRIGDLAVGLKADHVEPGVSSKNKEKDEQEDTNRAYNILSCIGNEATVLSGEAKGSKGVVVGKHGGIEHVLIDFPLEVLQNLVPGDKILIKTFGIGLELTDFPQVKVFSLDPGILSKIGLEGGENGKLKIGVTHIVPAELMGSGLGSNQVQSGDYDIQLFDDESVEKYGLRNLRFGDIVAITDADHSYGRIFYKGALSVGVVVHSNCVYAGHGPGVTSILTSKQGIIEPYINPNANLALLLGLRDSI